MLAHASALKLIAMFAAAFLLNGCANHYYRVNPVLNHSAQSAPDDNQTGDSTGKHTQNAPINLDDPKSKYNTLYEAAHNGAQTSRNELQDKIIELSDAICEQHKGDVIGNASQINLATGLGATVLSGASAIVTGAAAASYATGATILNGTKTAVNSEIYQGLFTTAIIKAIEESRDKKRNEILAKQGKETGEYSVDAAVNDAQDYHFRCSFYHGLVIPNEDSKKRAAPTRAELLGKIDALREEMKKNNQQKKLTSDSAINADDTNKKIQQGINALYDKLNLTD